MDNYVNWLNNLDHAQIRAFASQCGVGDWRDAEIDSLKKTLSKNSTGRRIFIQTFGENFG